MNRVIYWSFREQQLQISGHQISSQGTKSSC